MDGTAVALIQDMRSNPLLLLASSLLFTAACGTKVAYIPTNAPAHAPVARAPEAVDVYTVDTPARPFREIGLLEAQKASGFSFHERPEIFAALRKEAARRGCDGVILLGTNDKVDGWSSVSTTPDGGAELSHHTETLEGYRATCIVYEDAGLASVR